MSVQITKERWHFWRCPPDVGPPGAVSQSCVECDPIHWARGDSLNHIINRDVSGSDAQKQWRSKLYRTLKQQKHERDSAEYQKRLAREAEKRAREEYLAREAERKQATRQAYRAPPIRSRGCRKKKSDVGRVYK